MKKFDCIIALNLLLCVGIVSAQSPHCQIIFHSSEKTGLCTLDSLNTDEMILYITSKRTSSSFPIDSIAILIRFGERHTGEGMLIGTLAGAGLGAFAAIQSLDDDSPKSLLFLGYSPGMYVRDMAFLGGMAGLVIGTAAGTAVQDKVIYDFRNRKQQEKIQIIQWLVLMKQ